MRIPDDNLLIEPRIKMKRLSLRVRLRKSNDKRAIRIAKRNGRDHEDMSRREGFRDIVAKGVIRIGDLHRRVRRWKGLAMVDLVDVLNILINGQATDLLEGQPELVSAIRCAIQCDVEAVVTHEDVDLECVPYNSHQMCKLVVVTPIRELIVFPPATRGLGGAN